MGSSREESLGRSQRRICGEVWMGFLGGVWKDVGVLGGSLGGSLRKIRMSRRGSGRWPEEDVVV